ncbi:MAG: hypothetical protein ACREXS_00150 [Gammaproteobacteria bacterium]
MRIDEVGSNIQETVDYKAVNTDCAVALATVFHTADYAIASPPYAGLRGLTLPIRRGRSLARGGALMREDPRFVDFLTSGTRSHSIMSSVRFSIGGR